MEKAFFTVSICSGRVNSFSGCWNNFGNRFIVSVGKMFSFSHLTKSKIFIMYSSIATVIKSLLGINFSEIAIKEDNNFILD